MDLKQYKAAVEAMLFATGEPIGQDKLASVLEIEEPVVERLLYSLKDEYEKAERGLCLLQLEDRWQLATKKEYGEQVKNILDTRRNTPLSPAALETLLVGLVSFIDTVMVGKVGSAAIAAVAGVLVAFYQTLSFNSGAQILLLIFAAVTLGGLGSAYGALVGAILLSCFIELSTFIIPTSMKTVAAMLVMILILLVRPQGIFGSKQRIG